MAAFRGLRVKPLCSEKSFVHWEVSRKSEGGSLTFPPCYQGYFF